MSEEIEPFTNDELIRIVELGGKEVDRVRANLLFEELSQNQKNIFEAETLASAALCFRLKKNGGE